MAELDRRTVLAAVSAAAVATAFPSRALASPSSLRSAASRRGIVYGAATATYQQKDADFAAALAQETGILVPEYELKRFLVEPHQGVFDFSASDTLLKIATSNGQMFRGHALVWHAANPDWLEPAVLETKDERLLTDYVSRVATHFRGRLHSWDVVNEAIRPEDGRADGLRNSFWLKAFGPAYIDMAFHAAQRADPDAMLVYNDFGCEAGGPANEMFRTATLRLLDGMIARGTPIHAYGMQGHLLAYGSHVEQRSLARFLDEIGSRGLKLLVTEHDVDDSGGPDDVVARDKAVADASRRFLDVALDNRATAAVLTWGLSDRYLHVPGMSAMLFSRGLRKLPLDAELNRLPLWQAMADSFVAA